MKNELQIFNSSQFGEVRTIQEADKVLFCGSDVAKALGYAKPQNAIAAHCKGALKRGIPTAGGKQTMLFIPEGDIYRLAAKSELPGAEAFESWIFDEVLPSIRKTGEYATPQRAQQKLGETNAAARIIRQTLKEAGMAPQFVAVAMKSLYAPVGVEIPLEGITLNKRLYDATAIADHCGLLSKAGKPHGQAVGAIIAQVGVQSGEAELVPFQNPHNGHSGTTTQYTDAVLRRVEDWIESNGKPQTIGHGGKKFSVVYR